MATIDTSKLSSKIQGKYSVSNNSFSTVAKNNPKDKIDVIIGDNKQPDKFFPQVKLTRWDNEVNVSVRLKDNSKTTETITTDNDKIIWQKGNIKAEYFELPQDDTNPEGAYEFNVILDKKPASNVLEFTIETKELDFFYQPELTQEEIEQGASRPENVVGSYAVYHKTKGGMNDSAGMEYKTGKAFHIYRPEISDSKGNKVWGELNVDVVSKILTVTVPQKFLDVAVYPVIIDPTFGYTTGGSSTQYICFYYNSVYYRTRRGLLKSPPDSGNVTQISAHLRADTNRSIDHIVFLNQLDSEGSNQHGELVNSETLNLALTTTAGWKNFNTSSTAISSSSDYIINILANDGDLPATNFAGSKLSWDYSTPRDISYNKDHTSYSNGKEDPWTGTSSGLTKDLSYSIYATYTASSSSAIKTVNTLAKASVKTINGLAIASVKTWDGLV